MSPQLSEKYPAPLQTLHNLDQILNGVPDPYDQHDVIVDRQLAYSIIFIYPNSI